jgi:PAS domain S-box-containing protein
MKKISSDDEAFAVYGNLPEAYVVLFDADGAIRRANPRYMNLLRLSEDRLLSANYFDPTHPDDREKEQSAFAVLLDSIDNAFILEKRFVLPGPELAHYGTIFHVACMVSRFDSQDGASFLAFLDELKVYRHFRDHR